MFRYTSTRLPGTTAAPRFIKAAAGCFTVTRAFSSFTLDEEKEIAGTTMRSSLSLNDSSSSSLLLQDYSLQAPDCNVPLHIAQRVGRNLHRRPNHPLSILQAHILEYFRRPLHDDQRSPPPLPQTNDSCSSSFQVYDNLSPIVSTRQNFDTLRIPANHVSRRRSDTYYLDAQTVLRTHTSAHQVDLLQQKQQDGKDDLHRFLVVGDVYRRDEIDKSHYPIFHQMEGVKVFTADDYYDSFGGYSNSSNCHKNDETSSSLSSSSSATIELSDRAKMELIERDLKQTLQGLAVHLFGADTEMRWVDEYFPFTHPSFELEIVYQQQQEWMEVLGCGVIHPDIMHNAGRGTEQGWAFGLGLERLAMILFQIPDIRLFWTDDQRFHQQFADGKIVPFEPYSKYPPCYKDMSFWIDHTEKRSNALPADNSVFHVNDLNELVRDIAGDLVEQVTLIDQFTHPKTGRTSHCYRISYRSMDRSLTNEEIDALQEQVRERVVGDLGVELR